MDQSHRKIKLAGTIYDFGEETLVTHLASISAELHERAFINGQDENLQELSDLIEKLSDYLRDNPPHCDVCEEIAHATAPDKGR